MESTTIHANVDSSLMSEHTDISSIEITSNPPIPDGESDRFKDCDCGEPLWDQHLLLDFTPNEEDTDYVQRKCCAFWEFINQQDDLDGLAAEPDLESTSSAGDCIPIKEDPKVNSQILTQKLKGLEMTAVSMLEMVGEKGLTDRAFESRLPTSHCNLGLNNYDEESAGRSEDEQLKRRSYITPSYKTKSQMIKSKISSQARVGTTKNIQDMCETLQKWDKKHPKCRPICKSRRRQWKGELQYTSAELLLERNPLQDCMRRLPMKVFPNSPCPLFARTRHVTVVERDFDRPPNVVRICQAPIDVVVDTPYLKLAQMLKNLGAIDAVKSRCPFCQCTGCCVCRASDYEPTDETRDRTRRRDMRDFDKGVKNDCQAMRIMY